MNQPAEQPRIFQGRLTLQHISIIKQLCARAVKDDGPDALTAMGNVSAALDVFQEVKAPAPVEEVKAPAKRPRKKAANA